MTTTVEISGHSLDDEQFSRFAAGLGTALQREADQHPDAPTCPNCGQAVREGSRHGETHHGSGGEHTICVSEPLVEPARPALETGHG